MIHYFFVHPCIYLSIHPIYIIIISWTITKLDTLVGAENIKID